MNFKSFGGKILTRMMSFFPMNPLIAHNMTTSVHLNVLKIGQKTLANH